MKSKKSDLILLAAGVVATSMGAVLPTANAQEASDRASARLEEVIVTARRKQENVQAIPLSMKALTTEELQNRSIGELGDLTRIIPGLRYSAEGGGQNTTISLRGLSKIPVGDGAPAVVTYFSEVPLASNGTNIPTFDLANIQVLKGPQGTLFGRNTIGGAVLISPKEPTFSTQGYLKGSVGNYNAYTAEGAFSMPLIDDKLAMRLAAQTRQRDGFVENVSGGDDLADADQISFRASFLFQPTENISNLTILDYFKADEAGAAAVLYEANPALLGFFDLSLGGFPLYSPFVADLAQAAAAQQATGPFKTNVDQSLLASNRKLQGFLNKLSIQLTDDLEFKNILSYRTTEVGVSSDTDGLPLLVGDGSELTSDALAPFFLPGPNPLPPGLPLDRLVLINPGQVIDAKQITAEFQLIGSALDKRMDWITGLLYLKEEPNGPQGRFFQQFQVQSSLVPGVGLFPPTPADTVHTVTESKSAFAQIGLDLSDWVTDGLKFNFGYRYTQDDVEACGAKQYGGTDSISAPYLDFKDCKALLGGGLGAYKTDSSASTWTIGLDYMLGDNSMVYITSRKGYRSAGLNTPQFNTPGTAVIAPYQEIDPEEVVDIEIGLKSDFKIGDMPARVNVAAYTMEYTEAVQFINVAGNPAIPPGDPATPNSSAFGVNAGDLTVEGVEFEGTLVPTTSLTLTVTAAYTSQDVDKIAGIPSAFSYTEDQVTLPTPEWSASAAFSWILPFELMDGAMTLNGDYYWTDDWQAQGDPLDGYHLSNFRLTWNSTNSGLDVALFVTNATDEEYISAPSVNLSSFPINTGLYGEPRQYGLEVTYRFDD